MAGKGQGLLACALARPARADADTAVHFHDDPLVEAMALAWRLSGTLVLARAFKADKKKGRLSSDGRLRRLLDAGQMRALIEAAKATAEHASNGERHALSIIRYLRRELGLATRGRGRPRRGEVTSNPGPGMLASIAFRSPSTPSAPTSRESHLKKFYGLKLRLYVRRRGLSTSISLADAIKALARDLDVDPSLRTPEGLTKTLDQFISDRSVARLAEAEVLFGIGGDSLATRMRRARKKLNVVLPLGAI